MTSSHQARQIHVRGVVQGVGFRPFVHRLANRYGIHGWVLNDACGVTIHAEGNRGDLERMLEELRNDPPPAAVVQAIHVIECELEGSDTFTIRPSQTVQTPMTRIAADLATCPACLRELQDPSDRRFRYPYINCTHCGPRYSIVRSLPYDRRNTTMAPWQLCPACQSEFDDLSNRRYHAQPTACPDCGPRYRLQVDAQIVSEDNQAIIETVQMLQHGAILAIKGIGGYHLACDATNCDSVHQLRQRKYRKEKPFAVMVRDLESARAIVQIDPMHESLLLSPSRPIVLAPARVMLPEIAPDRDEIGVMIPYSPLHALLFQQGAPSPMVLTSGNRSNEPIAFTEQDAWDRLGGIADGYLMGERPIARRVDDSVVAVRNNHVLMIRRARGFAPAAVAHFAPHARPLLALGADLKNTLTLVVDGQAMVSQHIGDLGEWETDQAFQRTVDDLLQMYGIQLNDLVVAHDAHPGFISTGLAKSLPCHSRVAVQHHRAHFASVVAEHAVLDEPLFGFVLDGTGYGDDGTVWGFEVFSGSVVAGLQRVGHLLPAPLPGGDASARYPVQAAAGYLFELDATVDFLRPPFAFPARYREAAELVRRGTRCFRTSSAGRLFDTVAALCGYTRENTYEGQAACWLEYQARTACPCAPYPFPEFDFRPLLSAVVADRWAGRPVAEIAYAFHAAVAESMIDAYRGLESRYGKRRVVISGGTFQNRLLHQLLADAFPPEQLLCNREVPCNDGGISLGQAAWASVAAR